MNTHPSKHEPATKDNPTLPFPVPSTPPEPENAEEPAPDAVRKADEAIAAVETMSRRIRDLARELNCLGFFDGDDDRPRAA